MRESRTERICHFIFFAALLNFLSFWLVAVFLGGDALSGKSEAGRYFLSNHGVLTEVSKNVFNYSLVHTISIWFTHPAGIIALVIAQRTAKRNNSR